MAICIEKASDEPRHWDANGNWIPHIDDLIKVHFVANGKTPRKYNPNKESYVEVDKSLLPMETRTLLKAEKNPWYVMATIYGDDYDKSSLTFNNYLMGELSQDDQAEVIHAYELQLGDVDIPSLSSGHLYHYTCFLDHVELQNFTSRGNVFLNESIFLKSATFKEIEFSRISYFNNVIFSDISDFQDSTFRGHVNFKNVISKYQIEFIGNKFHRTVDFEDSRFLNYVNFDNTKFFNNVYFIASEFFRTVIFRNVEFVKKVKFNNVKFLKNADFEGTTFSGESNFQDATFGGYTNFKIKKFENTPPSLHGAPELYSNTSFSNDIENWPDPKANHKTYYERLRYLTNKAMLHDEERFFDMQIMRCKEAYDREKLKTRKKGWLKHLGSYLVSRIYGALGNYGTSWGWPLFFLLGTPFVFAALYLAIDPHVTGISQTIQISFANAYGLLGIKTIVLGKVYCHFTGATQVIMAMQSIWSLILLFLFGLGVRSRFRVK